MATAFIITMDTEGDNLWARPREVTTRNAAWLPAFQQLAEKFGFQPTWLVNWEMAHSPACVEFLKDVLARGKGEVGLHPHAWDTPPLESLTQDDMQHHPFLGEYAEPLRNAKLERMTGILQETFQQPLRSHRAGRWGFDGRIARWLRQHGFIADCSVCPGVDWRSTKGDPNGIGGPDYRRAPHEPYFIDEHDVTKPAFQPPSDALLEVPMTIGESHFGLTKLIGAAISPRHHWLRPNGRNRAAMIERVNEAVEDGRAHLMFMLHSSELMPGGSPTFLDEASILRLNEDLEALFAHARACDCRGQTLGDFATEWRTATVSAN
ncbi:MAG TPA: hypothetical protein VK737_03690 [Opitutales bacterium]|jgi:hypothetical protein|nr:hypothetical protein [Opitutales bacterium]